MNKKIVTLSVTTFLYSLVPSTFSSAYRPQQSFLSADDILNGWESNYAQIDSMKVICSDIIVSFEASQENPQALDNLVRYQYVDRIEKGKRYHIRHSMAENGFADENNLLEYSFDGEITREYWGVNKYGFVNPGLTGKDVETLNPLNTYMRMTRRYIPGTQEKYPDGMPWFSLIMSSGNTKKIVLAELETVAQEPCHVVKIVKNDPSEALDFKIWVAHEKGMLPVKYQYYQEGKMVSETQYDKIAKAKTEYGDIWYPLKARRTVNNNDGIIKYELTTELFVPYVEVDENSFRFDFPDGTKVVDYVAQMMYTVGVGGIDKVNEVRFFNQSEPDNKVTATAENAPTRREVTLENEKSLTPVNPAEKNATEPGVIPIQKTNVEKSHSFLMVFVVAAICVLVAVPLVLYSRYIRRSKQK